MFFFTTCTVTFLYEACDIRLFQNLVNKLQFEGDQRRGVIYRLSRHGKQLLFFTTRQNRSHHHLPEASQ